MSLATRCTSCSTVFRVVQDQLKVSEGWVRCGRCDAVFNALERLFDLDRESPAAWDEPIASGDLPPEPGPDESRQLATAAPALGPAADSSLPGDVALTEDVPTASTSDAPFADPVDAHLFGPRKRTESAPKPAGKVGARDRLEFSDARFDSDLFEENASLADPELDETVSTDVAALPLESTMRPDFLRRAERRARWRSTPVRTALGVGSVLALATLLLQVGHHGRDVIAAQWPVLRPALAGWCAAAGCSIGPPRRIDDILVDSTALTRTPGLDSFVLSVNLKNRGPLPLSLPWVDLNLTDGNGRLVARRALGPRDFNAAEVLPSNGEAALRLGVSTGAATVAGYTVEIFYP